MRTRTVEIDSALAAVRDSMNAPGEVYIVGAETYWLEDTAGVPQGTESDRTAEPFARALDLVGAGANADTLIVWCRLTSGERYRVAGGANLIVLAERAAGIPARPRVLRE